MSLAKQIAEEHEELRALKAVNDRTYNDIGELCYPKATQFGSERSDFEPLLEEEQVGSPLGQVLSEDLTNTICYSTTPTNTDWLEFEFENPDYEENIPMRMWKQRQEKLVLSQLGNPSSRFYGSRYECVRMGSSFGTGYTFVGTDYLNKMPYYMTIPFENVFIADDDRGRISVVHLIVDMKKHQLISKYGKENIPEDILRSNNNQLQHRVVICIKPRGYGYEGARKKNKPIAEYHLLKDKCLIIKEDGYDEMPGAGFRWSKVAGTPYGWSPAMSCFKSLKQIEIMRDTTVRASELAVLPPTNVPYGMVGKIGLYPGYINEMLGDQKVEPIRMGAQPQYGFNLLEYLANECRGCFYSDAVNLRIKKERQSVREISALENEQLAKMEGVFSPLENEYFKSLITRHWNILRMNGWVEPPPVEMKGGIKLVFKNRVTQAQQMARARNVTEFVQFELGSLGAAYPDIFKTLHPERTLKLFSDTRNVPLEIFKTPEEQEQQLEAEAQIAQQNQMMQQAQAMKLGSEALKNASQAQR